MGTIYISIHQVPTSALKDTADWLIVGEFSSICCTSMAHAGNTKIWAKIISAYAKKCSITGFSSLRGGGGAKNASIYALSGHERIEKPSDQ